MIERLLNVASEIIDGLREQFSYVASEISDNLLGPVANVARELSEFSGDFARGLYSVFEDVAIGMAKYAGQVPLFEERFEGLKFIFMSDRVFIRNTLRRQVKNVSTTLIFGRDLKLGRLDINLDEGYIKIDTKVIPACTTVERFGVVMFGKKFIIEVDGESLEIDLQEKIPIIHFLAWHYLQI